MKKVFIDGSAGTTGLRIKERLSARTDLTLLTLPEELRKDDGARKEKLNEADIVFLCLPDAESVKAVSMIENENTAVLDTSTAHRTAPGWAYGFPELGKNHLEKIRTGKRIAVPGCHASGFIALIAPLVRAGIIMPDTILSCTSLTGYSGGGKKMIAQYNEEGRDALLSAPRTYGLTQTHKHLKEMKALCLLDEEPLFMPIVSDFYSGMSVSVPCTISRCWAFCRTSERSTPPFIRDRSYALWSIATRRASFRRASSAARTAWRSRSSEMKEDLP